MNQPFILNLHDQESPKIRLLREEELSSVAGGNECPREDEIPTMTVTPNGDGGDDGCDPVGGGSGSTYSAFIGMP